MRRRALGNTGLDVSELSLGGLFLGELGNGRDPGAVLNKAADLGINLLDTAPAYKGSEDAIGKAWSPELRKKFVLVTKWWAYENDGKTLVTDPGRLRLAVEGSLARLRTDHLDVFLFHSVTQPGDIEKIGSAPMQAELAKLKKEGKILHVGLSNEGKDDPKDARLIEAAHAGNFEVVMPEFLIFRQGSARELFPLCVQKKLGVIAITPLGQAAWGYGLRDKKTLMASLELFISKGQLADEPRWRDPGVLDFLLDSKTPDLAAAALRFCLSFPGVSSVCCGTSDPLHLEENARVCESGPYDAPRLAMVAELFGHLSAVPR